MLDNKDNKILAEIVNNARIPVNSLSKKVHISKELISYHIKKLEGKEVILGYQARLNLNFFSILAYNLLVKLSKYDKEREKRFVEFIKVQKYTHFIAKVGGNYDYIISFTIKRISDLKVYLNFMYENFGDLIAKHELFTYIGEVKDDFATLFDKSKNYGIVSMSDCDKNFVLDEVDKEIIKEITSDAKVSSVFLGEKLGLTSAAIAYRIKKLENNNVILGYRTIVDILKFNKQFYYVFFNVDVPNVSNEKRVINEMRRNPNILFTNMLAGSYSFLCMVVSDNNNEFYEILQDIQNKVGVITDINIFSILDFVFHNYIPNGFMD